ncbi:MAG TPA: DUF6526 family protein [Candidatus Methylomirabilis sp.]|nr:DUF6526 family protein [Candidatus Methylomirabilis sp.]
MKEQNFANHVRIVPPFHLFVLPMLLLNLIWAVYKFIHTFFSFDALVTLLLALALILLAPFARMFALSVQDRVIRLEMRLRMEKLLPTDLKSRIDEFSVSQLVALRFASDAELPELARRVLADKLDNRKAIKRLIKTWKPDYLRA